MDKIIILNLTDRKKIMELINIKYIIIIRTYRYTTT